MKKQMLCLLLIAAFALQTAACGDKEPATPPVESTSDSSEVTTKAPETDADTSAETETETPEPETTAPEPEDDRIVNPLTGLESDIDFEDRRPVAIMINNIKPATPQEGISYADVMYECIVEGGYTRLMMLAMDYENLPVVGSVRSSREYYLDFAANHDAIYIHAGGSEQAYTEMKQRKVDHLDGVNMSIPGMFYRDAWRQANMGLEHSLMTDGERIVKGIDYVGCRTEMTPDFDSPLDFVAFGETVKPENPGTYLQVTYYSGHKPYFKYDENEGVYYRWQFSGDKHIDNTANVQLSFTNIIVLYLPTINLNDEKGHKDVETTGSGEGYYFTMGGYEEISWTKADEDSPIKLYSADGEELQLNRGKTFFQICTTSMRDSTVIK